MKNLAKAVLILEAAFFFLLLLDGFSWFHKRNPIDFSGEKEIIVDDNGFAYRTVAKGISVNEVLAENNILLAEEDKIFPPREAEVLPGMNILIKRAARIKISADGKEHEKITFAGNVERALMENNITLSHVDLVEPHLQTRLNDDMDIVVTRIKKEEIIDKEVIKYKLVEKKDKSLYWGEEEVTQAGENGMRETSYEIVYENGIEVSRKKLSSKIIKSPVNRVVSIGTKLKIGETKTGIASWYSHTGTMACTSRTFPYGTWLRVTNLENSKQTYTVVNDYGPQKGTDRLIDLDKVAFDELAPLEKGLIKVRIEEITSKGFNPSDYP